MKNKEEWVMKNKEEWVMKNKEELVMKNKEEWVMKNKVEHRVQSPRRTNHVMEFRAAEQGVGGDVAVVLLVSMEES